MGITEYMYSTYLEQDIQQVTAQVTTGYGRLQMDTAQQVATSYGRLQQQVTAGYRSLQPVTRGYSRLELVYRRFTDKLQQITTGYINRLLHFTGLQQVTEGYRRIQQVKEGRSRL